MRADSRSIKAEAARLRGARPLIMAEARAIVAKGALEVKKQMQLEASGIRHAPGLPAAISYDLQTLPTEVGFEVGPVEGGAGSLALLYYGNSRTGSVIKDPAFALRRQAVEIERQLTDLMMRKLG